MRPNVKILATGGTIAGTATSSTATTNYRAGALGIDVLIGALIDAVPQLRDCADVAGEQICNIDSKDMTDDVWLALANRSNELLTGGADGIVITHGTDTLEETAYFLNLTVRRKKPVVLTGAMRPATALSSDGAMNLLNAVRIAASPASIGRGVLVTLNDEIHAAREVTKAHTLKVSAFQSRDFGLLGCVNAGVPEFFRTTTRRHTVDSEFRVEEISALPRVEIIFGHANGDGLFVSAATAAGAKGIVFAGTGNGSIHANVEKSLLQAAAHGVVVVRTSRVGCGSVTADGNFTGGGDLTPQKARILLQLALTRTNDLVEIQRIFRQY